MMVKVSQDVKRKREGKFKMLLNSADTILLCHIGVNHMLQ